MPKQKQIKQAQKKTTAAPSKFKFKTILRNRNLLKKNTAKKTKYHVSKQKKSKPIESNSDLNQTSDVDSISSEESVFEVYGLHPYPVKREISGNIFYKLYNEQKEYEPLALKKSNPHWSLVPVPNLLYDVRHTFVILQKWFNPFLTTRGYRKIIPEDCLKTCIKPNFSDFISVLSGDLELQGLFLLAIYECIRDINCTAFVEERVTKNWKESPHCFNHVALYAFSGDNCNLWKPITDCDNMPKCLDFLNSPEFPNVKELKCIFPRHLEKLRLDTLKKMADAPQSCNCCRLNFEINSLKHHPDETFVRNYSNKLPIYEKLESTNKPDEPQCYSTLWEWNHSNSVQTRSLLQFAAKFCLDYYEYHNL